MVYNGKPENTIKIDDLRVPLFLETPKYISGVWRILAEIHLHALIVQEQFSLVRNIKFQIVPVEVVYQNKMQRHSIAHQHCFFPVLNTLLVLSKSN